MRASLYSTSGTAASRAARASVMLAPLARVVARSRLVDNRAVRSAFAVAKAASVDVENLGPSFQFSIKGMEEEQLAAPDTPQSQAAGVAKRKPAEWDAERFELDKSVFKWQNYSPAYILSPETDTSKLTSGQELFAKIAASAAQDSQSALYWAYHTSRFSFFLSQGVAGLLAHTVSEQLDAGGTPPTPDGKAGTTPFFRLLTSAGPEIINRLSEGFGTWEQDLEYIRAGIYKLPWDMTTPNRQFSPLHIASRTIDFMAEGAATLRRRMRNKAEPVWLDSDMYPSYYKKTFHYQTDGWFSDRSARIYEHSTETLFMGRQDAMQRSVLPAISDWIRTCGKPASELRLLEVAAGTGRFHTFIKDNWPEMRSVCSDLSPFYLQKARDNLQQWKRLRQPNKWLGGADDTGVEYKQMAAEKLQCADQSFDIVVCIYLFHELPEPVRRKAVREWFRALKPGGLCVFSDSGQLGDRPEWDASIGLFGDFNEPHYVSYINQDLGKMFEEEGFVPQKKWVSSATKTLSFIKPL